MCIRDRVQALADISRSALCCHSNETRAPLVNPPDSAQLEAIPLPFPNLHPGPCSSVGMQRRTDRHTQTAVTKIHFALATSHAKCSKTKYYGLKLYTICRCYTKQKLRSRTNDTKLSAYLTTSGGRCQHKHELISGFEEYNPGQQALDPGLV